jgi:hypothetical protein
MAGRERTHDVVLALLGLAVATLAAWTVWHGFSYYTTLVADRAHHPDYRALRSAGDVGHGLGILGSAMVLIMLLYSVRKRAQFARRWGDSRIWLRYHIFLGVAGPVLITLHTAFKIDGLVAVSYWSMVAVALSGVLGRYLYQQIPRNMLGDTLSPQEIEARAEAMLVDLSGTHGLDQRAIADLEHLAIGRLENHSSAYALLVLPVLNARSRGDLQAWAQDLAPPLGAGGSDLARHWVLLARRLHLFHTVRDLFHWWHVVHKPFAAVMILVMVVHVGVAVALGYVWRF